jgi:F-type H+-transporting ATPase subunit a
MSSRQHLRILAFLIASIFFQNSLFASEPNPTKGYDPTPEVMHHIGDAHQFHLVGDYYLPLPCITYAEGNFFFALSSDFEYDKNLHRSKKAIQGYFLYHDQLMRLVDKNGNSPAGTQNIEEPEHHALNMHEEGEKKSKDEAHEASHHAHQFKVGEVIYEMEAASALQKISSWYDFSITKNVFSMFLAMFLLILIFGIVSNAYKNRVGKAPKGIQSLLEPVIEFMKNEVIKPSVGVKWEKYFPFLMTIFFFILVSNLLGLIPFFPGSSNITGNLGVTMVLAFFTFLMTNLSGNKGYWGHIFAMPGVPKPILLILTPIEIVGIFIKPITLFIRLFANITAGHIIILSLVSLIFVFGNLGENMAGAAAGAAVAVPFVFAMNFLELFVAFLQAFIFTLLSALYIGTAVEEHHHEGDHAHH